MPAIKLATRVGNVPLVCFLLFLPKQVRAEACSDGSGECCADATTVCDLVWTVSTNGNDVRGELGRSGDSSVVCVQDDGGDLPSLIQVDLPEKSSVTICGNAEGAQARFPPLDITFGNDEAELHLMDLSIVWGDGFTSRGAVHVLGKLNQFRLERMAVDSWLYVMLLALTDWTVPTVTVSGLTIDSSTTSLMRTNADVRVVFEETPDQPALHYGGLRSVPLFMEYETQDSHLTLSGSLRRTPDSAGPVAGLTNSSSGFGTVTLENLSVQGYDCEVCVEADTIHAVNTTWELAQNDEGASAGPGLWLKANDEGSGSSAGLVTLNQVTFRTDGPPWQLARAGRVQAVGLDYCAAGTNTPDSTDYLGAWSVSGSASIWNSAIVVANDSGPLVGDAGGRLGLRGVTVVTGNTTAGLVPDMSELQATNTLFVGKDTPASEALADRDEGWPPHVLLAPAADDVFQSPSTVFSCEAPPIPDAGTTGTRGKGVQKYTDESGEEQLLWSLARSELGDVRPDLEQGEDWCDPDGTDGSWPDIGAWSGPLSSNVFDPQVDDPQRPCSVMQDDTSSPPVDTATPDSGETPDSGGTDTSGPGPDDAGDPANLLRYSWGGTCGGCGGSAAVVVPVMALWWRRRQRRIS